MRQEGCVFCRSDDASRSLLQSANYRLVPDEYPRAAGHVLLITRQHFDCHMAVPTAGQAELDAWQLLMRGFLQDVAGGWTFYENGGRDQEVPHAHLHGLPFRAEVSDAWIVEGRVQPSDGWREHQAAYERQGYYFYLQSASGTWLVRDRQFVRRQLIDQLVAATEAQHATNGDLHRYGPDTVARTRYLFEDWWKQHHAQFDGLLRLER